MTTPTDLLTPADLRVLAPDINDAEAQALIDHATQLALVTAPCIADPGFAMRGALRAVLTGAILRWHAAGDGSVSTVTAGPFSKTQDTTSKRLLFFPSELKSLQQLCGRGGRRRVFSVSMDPGAR